MKKRLIAALLSAVLTASMIAGCTAQEKGPITEEEEVQEAEAEEEEETEEDVDKSGEEEMDLTEAGAPEEEEGEEEAEEYEAPSEEEYYETSTGLSLDYVATILIDIQEEKGKAKPNLVRETKKDAIEKVYPGVADLDPIQVVCYLSPDGEPVEMMLLECRSSSDANKAAQILEARKNQGESEEGWKGAKIFTTSNLTALICLGEDAYMPNDVFILD